MKRKNNENGLNTGIFVGFTYFSVPLMGIDGWWAATDPNGEVNMFRTRPIYDEEQQCWQPPHQQSCSPAGTFLKIADLEFDTEHARDTLQQIKRFEHPEDKRMRITDHNAETMQMALSVLAMTGLPDRNALTEMGEATYLEKLEKKKNSNSWDYFFPDVLPVFAASCFFTAWSWTSNTACKYNNVTVRTDMRDLGCIIRDRDNNRILPERLAHQYVSERNEERRLRYINDQCKANQKEREANEAL